MADTDELDISLDPLESDQASAGAAQGVELLSSLGLAFTDEGGAQLAEGEDDLVPLPVDAPVEEVHDPPAFSMSRVMFAAMVEQAMLVVPTKDFYPALKNMVVDVVGGDAPRLTITGSDSVSTIVSTTTVVSVSRPGRVLIGAKRFSDIVRLAAGAQIDVDCDDKDLRIASGSASWSLRVASVQDYPPLPELGDLAWHAVERAAFERAISGTRYATSSDDAKDHLQQVDISAQTVTASDGFRFAQVSAPELPVGFAAQISSSGVDLLTKMLTHNEADEFRLAVAPYHIAAEIGPPSAPDRIIVARIMREFPEDARAAIAVPLAENRDVLVASIADLSEALRRAAPTSDEETGAVALRLGSPEDGKVTLETRNRYGDLSREVLDGSFTKVGSDTVADARSVLVSGSHLRAALKALAEASPAATDGEEAAAARILLGKPKPNKASYVLLADSGETVHAVLAPVRSDWLI